jgi:hypothetical protein
LVGADPVALLAEVAAHHVETHPLSGRDLSGPLRGIDELTAEPAEPQSARGEPDEVPATD